MTDLSNLRQNAEGDARKQLARSMSEATLLGNILDLNAKARLGWKISHQLPARTGRKVLAIENDAVVEKEIWATNVQGDPGMLDLFMARGGRIIVAELKRQNGKLTPAEKDWWDEIGSGIERYLWRPSSWLSGEIERTLRGEE